MRSKKKTPKFFAGGSDTSVMRAAVLGNGQPARVAACGILAATRRIYEDGITVRFADDDCGRCATGAGSKRVCPRAGEVYGGAAVLKPGSSACCAGR